MDMFDDYKKRPQSRQDRDILRHLWSTTSGSTTTFNVWRTTEVEEMRACKAEEAKNVKAEPMDPQDLLEKEKEEWQQWFSMQRHARHESWMEWHYQQKQEFEQWAGEENDKRQATLEEAAERNWYAEASEGRSSSNGRIVSPHLDQKLVSELLKRQEELFSEI